MKLKKYSLLISLLFIIIVDVCLPACACHPKLPSIAQNSVIVAFGDSITYGTGAQPIESYPAVLEKMIGRRVINAGYPGEVTGQGVTRLPVILDLWKPSLLLLCLGINDQLLNVDPKISANHLREMIKIARKRNVSVVLIAVPDMSLSPSKPPMYAEIARKFCIPIEEEALSTINAPSHKSFKADILHPNAAGYYHMARAIAILLQKNGAIP